MRALIPTLLTVLSLAACADPPPAASPRGGNGDTASPAAAPKDDGFAELTETECRVWADHFRVRLDEANRRRIEQCRKEVGGSAEAEKADARDLAEANAEGARLHALIIDQCSQQVGASYVQVDAACYMSAPRMEDWKSCPFQSMFFSDYKAVAKNHEKMFTERCAREKKSAAASGTGGNG